MDKDERVRIIQLALRGPIAGERIPIVLINGHGAIGDIMFGVSARMATGMTTALLKWGHEAVEDSTGKER